MFAKLFESTTVPALEQVVSFAQARHEVLAGNIANADTPGYRTRDLSPEVFQSRLKAALEARDSRATSPGDPAGSQFEMPKVEELQGGLLYHDDSNDSLEHQVAEISKNQMQHNLALTILNSQFRLLQAAISERV